MPKDKSKNKQNKKKKYFKYFAIVSSKLRKSGHVHVTCALHRTFNTMSGKKNFENRYVSPPVDNQNG